MSQKLDVLKETVYTKMIREPSKSDYTIAEETGVSRSYVWNLRQKFVRKLDYELAKSIAGAFLADFQHASDYFKLQITKLEGKQKELDDMKKHTKTIFKKTSEGQSYPETVELEVSDLLAIQRQELDIEKQKTDLWTRIMFMARQGEAAQIMKLIQNGRIQLPSQ